jgi:HAD superfamily hydrolase (TIGR01450 family)
VVSLPDPVPHHQRLSEIAPRYAAIISDVWGVVHNGIAATSGAPQALRAAREAGLPVVLLTNAPRPPHAIKAQLRTLGVPDEAYDGIVSSGGVTRMLIAREGGRPFFHLGPARDEALYAGLPAHRTTLEAADYILCTGLFDDETERAEDYRTMLDKARARGLRLYCANPDLVVERGEKIIPCAGAIASIYEAVGGETIWVGKPKPMVYAHARALIEERLGRSATAEEILCIGDAFRTDIAGAAGQGHDSLMTLAGIHAHQIGLNGGTYDQAAFEVLAAQNAARPTMTMASLVW